VIAIHNIQILSNNKSNTEYGGDVHCFWHLMKIAAKLNICFLFRVQPLHYMLSFVAKESHCL